MKNISLTFLVHQPVRFRRYRFFDIGNDNYYYEDYDNERKIRITADECYLPNNEILLKFLTRYKSRFKVSFSVSGTAINLFRLYAPEVIRSFQQLAATDGVEFIAETYAHSLASLKNTDEFRRQIERHAKKIADLFGNRPQVFKNTEFIYSDRIGNIAADEGFKTVLAEEAVHIPGWKGPNYLYSHPFDPRLKILFRNNVLSNLAASCLVNSEQKAGFFSLLDKTPASLVNLCIDYEIIGQTRAHGHNGETIGHFESFLTKLAESGEFKLNTLSEQSRDIQPLSEISIPDSYAVTLKSDSFIKLQGNELQQEALEKLYALKYWINADTDYDLWKDWQYIQSSDHFYYMSSRFFSNGHSDHCYNPYENPYEAFMNYMNILSDFSIRLHNIPVREIDYEQVTIKPAGKIAFVS